MGFDKKYCLLIAALLAMALLFGCPGIDPAPTNSPKNTIVVYVYEAPFDPNNLKEVKIATLTLNAAGEISAVPEQGKESSADYQKLTAALQEIKAKGSLDLTYEEIEMIDGHEALVMKVMPVSPGEENYIYALDSELGLHYDFECEVK